MKLESMQKTKINIFHYDTILNINCIIIKMIFDHFFDDVKKRLHRLLLPCRHKTYIRRAEDVQDVF